MLYGRQGHRLRLGGEVEVDAQLAAIAQPPARGQGVLAQHLGTQGAAARQVRDDMPMAQGQQALPQGAWWWFVPAGLCIALLGTALSLVNFGIDEFVNPRLRASGRSRVKTSDGGKVRMKVGFTPVLADPSRSKEIGI